MRILLLCLGFFSAILIVGQLVLGLLILNVNGNTAMVTGHKHSGYLTVAVTLTYIIFSMLAISATTKPEDL